RRGEWDTHHGKLAELCAFARENPPAHLGHLAVAAAARNRPLASVRLANPPRRKDPPPEAFGRNRRGRSCHSLEGSANRTRISYLSAACRAFAANWASAESLRVRGAVHERDRLE